MRNALTIVPMLLMFMSVHGQVVQSATADAIVSGLDRDGSRVSFTAASGGQEVAYWEFLGSDAGITKIQADLSKSGVSQFTLNLYSTTQPVYSKSIQSGPAPMDYEVRERLVHSAIVRPDDFNVFYLSAVLITLTCVQFHAGTVATYNAQGQITGYTGNSYVHFDCFGYPVQVGDQTFENISRIELVNRDGNSTAFGQIESIEARADGGATIVSVK